MSRISIVGCGAVLLLVVFGVYALVELGFPDHEDREKSEQVETAGPGPPAARRLELVGGAVQVYVAEESYISLWVNRTGAFGKPTKLDTSTLTLPKVDKRSSAASRAIVYELDGNGLIDDVLVLSRARRFDGSLVELQWIVSKDGVELTWPAENEPPWWSVERDGKVIEKDARGHFVDDHPLMSPTTYTVERVEKVRITDRRGNIRIAEKPTSHVLFLSEYKVDVLGKSFEDAVRGMAPADPFKRWCHGSAVEGCE